MPQPSLTEVNTPQSRCHFALGWADITPPAGMYHRMWGAAKHDRAAGVHRPLRATVAVFASLEDEHPTDRAQNPTAASEPQAGRPREQTQTHQILLALDHCVLGAVEHEQL